MSIDIGAMLGAASNTEVTGLWGVVYSFIQFAWGLISKAIELTEGNWRWAIVILGATFAFDTVVMSKFLWGGHRSLKRYFVSFLVVMFALSFFATVVTDSIIPWLETLI